MKTPLLAPPATVLGRVRTSYPRLLRILVPLDFSGRSRQALRYAVPVAQKFSARIHLVHVLPEARSPRDERVRRRFAALQRLGATAEQLLPPRVRGEVAVLAGRPAEGILAFVGRHEIDLIVLTTKGRGGLRRALLGGTAEQVMRQAPCPVMAVPRR